MAAQILDPPGFLPNAKPEVVTSLSLSLGGPLGAPRAHCPVLWSPRLPAQVRRRVSLSDTPTLVAVGLTYLNPVSLPLRYRCCMYPSGLVSRSASCSRVLM